MSVAGARVLVVDDEPGVRQVVRAQLRRERFQVIEAGNGLDALSLLRRGGVDIALIDLMLPELDGLELVRRVRRESTVPIILISGRADESSRVAGLEVGADDYIVKPFSLREMTSRVRANLRRVNGFDADEAVLSSGPVELDVLARHCRCNGAEVDLTRREFDLLTALLRYPGRIHTRPQLLQLVWDTEHFSAKTVDVHIASLRAKLGAAISIATLRGVGYRLDAATIPGVRN
jgi:DNA-binding response OmpR family regulator